jgi:hypothetical protein
MSEPKTKPTNESVVAFLNTVEKEKQREDSFAILDLMKDVTGEEAKMWGTSIIGFGRYKYKYASGREGEWMLVGFSPRKRNLTLYIMPGFEHYETLLSKLGTYTTGKSCLYVKTLEDVDQDVLRELVSESVDHMKKANE